MSYTIMWHEDALKDLKKVDRNQASVIIDKTEKHLILDPHKFGKPLTGHLRGFFRYRIGKYRIIYTIKEDELIILVLKIGKRDKVYRQD